MAPVFARLDGSPYCFWIQPQIPNSNRKTLKTAIKKGGGQLVSVIADSDFVLVERGTTDRRLHASGKIVLRHTWVSKCLEEGRLLGPADGWGGPRELVTAGSSSVEHEMIYGPNKREDDEEVLVGPSRRRASDPGKPRGIPSTPEQHQASDSDDPDFPPPRPSTPRTNSFDRMASSGLPQDTIDAIQSVYTQFQQAVSAFLPPGSNIPIPASPFAQSQLDMPPPPPPAPAMPPPPPPLQPSFMQQPFPTMQGMIPVLMPVQMYTQMAMWSSMMSSMGMGMPAPIPLAQLPDLGSWQQPSIQPANSLYRSFNSLPGWANGPPNPFAASGSNMSAAHISVPPSPAPESYTNISAAEKGKGREIPLPPQIITPGPSGSDSPSEPRYEHFDEPLDEPEPEPEIKVFSTERGSVGFYIPDDSQDRAALIEAINRNGGKCVGLAAADFVVLGNQHSKRTLSATASLPPVTVAWIFDCIDRGKLLPVKNYQSYAAVSSDPPELELASSSGPVSRSSTSQTPVSRPTSATKKIGLGLSTSMTPSKRTPSRAQASMQRSAPASEPDSARAKSVRRLDASTPASKQRTKFAFSSPAHAGNAVARTPSTKSRAPPGPSSLPTSSHSALRIPAKRPREVEDSPDLPSPPKKRVALRRGYEFTDEDEQYLMAYTNARLARDPKLSMVSIFREIGAKASWHSAKSWENHYYRRRDFLNTHVEPDESDQDDSSEDDGPDEQPQPPVAPSPRGIDRSKYTEVDKQYLIKFAQWMRRQDPGCSRRQIFLEIAERAPHHSFSGWTDFHQRNKAEIDPLIEVPGARPRRGPSTAVIPSPPQSKPDPRPEDVPSSVSPVRQSTRTRRPPAKLEDDITPPPSPTDGIVPYGPGGRFTKVDEDFLISYGRWFTKHNPDESIEELIAGVAEAAPQHSKSSWQACFLRREEYYVSEIFGPESREMDILQEARRRSSSRSRSRSRRHDSEEKKESQEEDFEDPDEEPPGADDEVDELDENQDESQPEKDEETSSTFQRRIQRYSEDDFEAVVALHRQIEESPEIKNDLWTAFQKKHPTHTLGAWKEYARQRKHEIQDAM